MESSSVKTIYLMGIGGIAMGTLATMLKEIGFHVVGSDVNLYPPMSTHLESIAVPVFQGYDAANVAKSSPDMVVIGNVIRRDNPEAQFVMNSGIPYLSMPEAIERFFLSRHRSIVVSGTHGKSTTSSLLAWLLTHAGLDPSAFIGAFLKNWQRSYRVGKGRFMVLEGDEYDTAFFDKGPKFLHYRPHIAVMTSIEFDHADIFANFDAVVGAFEKFVELIEPDGTLIANVDDPTCMAVSRRCNGRVVTYGRDPHADWRLMDLRHEPHQVRFSYVAPDSRTPQWMVSPLPGMHNALNTLAGMAVASVSDMTMDQVQAGLLAFRGVKRRQDVVGEAGGVLVVDDFAHHPTAVQETIQALRRFYPDRRLIAAFEPRTNSSRRRVFQEAYVTAFDGADCICIKEPPGMQAIPEEERLDTGQLVRGIQSRNRNTFLFEDVQDLVEFLVRSCTSGDLVLCMSNGSFDALPQRLLKALETRAGLDRADHPPTSPRR